MCLEHHIQNNYQVLSLSGIQMQNEYLVDPHILKRFTVL